MPESYVEVMMYQGTRRMSECFAEVNMYQGTRQIKYYKIEFMQTKEVCKPIQ